jgi:predicted nuclease of restriction endonuclease-like (RecB) superfamily
MSAELRPLSVTPAVAPLPSGYGDFLFEIKTQIRQRQFQALRAANRELLQLYWWLGENISRRQTEQGWGKAVVENLARDLQAEFPGRNGFSTQNLWLMRQLFNEYNKKPKLQSLIGEIGTELKTRFQQVQLKAAVAVNTALLKFYWELGTDIVARQVKSDWGSGCLNQLSPDLMREFPEMKGFSVRNLKYIRQWYSFYAASPVIGQQAVAQLARRSG